jgi:uncharacterized membrane protein
MTDTNTRGLRAGRYQGLAVVAIGISHFLVPHAFDPINRLGFPEHPRKFTYINGAIETMIGVLVAVPRSRRQLAVVSACYVIYLTGNIIRTQTGICTRQVRVSGRSG